MFVFRKILRVLFSWNTHFEIRPLPYYRRYIGGFSSVDVGLFDRVLLQDRKLIFLFYITIYHYLEKVIPCLFNLVGKWEPEGWGMRIIFIYLCFPLCLAPCFAFGLQRITKLRLEINISSIFKYFQYYCVSVNTK